MKGGGIALIVAGLIVAVAVAVFFWTRGDGGALIKKEFEEEIAALKARLMAADAAVADSKVKAADADRAAGKAKQQQALAEEKVSLAKERLAAIMNSPDQENVALVGVFQRYALQPTIVAGMMAFTNRDANEITKGLAERGACFEELRAQEEVSVAATDRAGALERGNLYRDGVIEALEKKGAVYEEGRTVLERQAAVWEKEYKRERWRKRGWMLVAGVAAGGAVYLAGR